MTSSFQPGASLGGSLTEVVGKAASSRGGVLGLFERGEDLVQRLGALQPGDEGVGRQAAAHPPAGGSGLRGRGRGGPGAGQRGPAAQAVGERWVVVVGAVAGGGA